MIRVGVGRGEGVGGGRSGKRQQQLHPEGTTDGRMAGRTVWVVWYGVQWCGAVWLVHSSNRGTASGGVQARSIAAPPHGERLWRRGPAHSAPCATQRRGVTAMGASTRSLPKRGSHQAPSSRALLTEVAPSVSGKKLLCWDKQ